MDADAFASRAWIDPYLSLPRMGARRNPDNNLVSCIPRSSNPRRVRVRMMFEDMKSSAPTKCESSQ